MKIKIRNNNKDEDIFLASSSIKHYRTISCSISPNRLTRYLYLHSLFISSASIWHTATVFLYTLLPIFLYQWLKSVKVLFVILSCQSIPLVYSSNIKYWGIEFKYDFNLSDFFTNKFQSVSNSYFSVILSKH